MLINNWIFSYTIASLRKYVNVFLGRSKETSCLLLKEFVFLMFVFLMRLLSRTHLSTHTVIQSQYPSTILLYQKSIYKDLLLMSYEYNQIFHCAQEHKCKVTLHSQRISFEVFSGTRFAVVNFNESWRIWGLFKIQINCRGIAHLTETSLMLGLVEWGMLIKCKWIRETIQLS